MDEEKLSKFVKLPTFDGDEEKFQLWLVRFEAYTTCCGFRAGVGDAPEAELPENNKGLHTDADDMMDPLLIMSALQIVHVVLLNRKQRTWRKFLTGCGTARVKGRKRKTNTTPHTGEFRKLDGLLRCNKKRASDTNTELSYIRA